MSRHHPQSGFLLIEALVAIAIFAIGILGLMAMQGMVVRETADAQYRIEASAFVDQIIAEMRAACGAPVSTGTGIEQSCQTFLPPGAATNPFASPGGARYLAWRSQVITTATGGLPGASAVPPTIVFNGNQVTVSVFWRQPGETQSHQHVVTTQIH